MFNMLALLKTINLFNGDTNKISKTKQYSDNNHLFTFSVKKIIKKGDEVIYFTKKNYSLCFLKALLKFFYLYLPQNCN